MMLPASILLKLAVQHANEAGETLAHRRAIAGMQLLEDLGISPKSDVYRFIAIKLLGG